MGGDDKTIIQSSGFLVFNKHHDKPVRIITCLFIYPTPKEYLDNTPACLGYLICYMYFICDCRVAPADDFSIKKARLIRFGSPPSTPVVKEGNYFTHVHISSRQIAYGLIVGITLYGRIPFR